MKEFDEFDDYDGGIGEPIDLMKYVKRVLGAWKKVLLFALCGAILGVVIALGTPRTYTSKAVVAPELVTRATSGGLSTLASLAGVNMNTMALTDAMHPDMYPSIINSTGFYIDLFDMPVVIEKKDTVIHTDLYDYMANYTKHPWWGYVLGLPFMAKDAVFRLFSKPGEKDEAEGHSEMDSLRLTREQERVVKAMSKCITSSLEKRTYLLSINVTTQDPVISANLANAAVEELKAFVISYRTEKSKENVEYFQDLYTETREDYLRAQRAYANYMDSHQNIISKGTQVYQQQLQNEAQLRFQMYSQTAQNLMNAEAKLQQEAPVLVVIQHGMAPRVGKPSRVKLVILWFILGALAGSIWACIKKENQPE
ncbi:MAG: hypothetical protein J5737_03290 [Bacteroidales bacterium]|nr:hypothetical protein [Bacteroidales bacterium]